MILMDQQLEQDRLVQNRPDKNVADSVITAMSSELASYTYTDGPSWKGFAGSVCERTGVSHCSQVAVAFRLFHSSRLYHFQDGI